MNVIQLVKDKLSQGDKITYSEAKSLLGADKMELFRLANSVRERFVGNEVVLCSITNAKSGHCPEDCKFCGQSSHFDTSAPTYRFQDLEELKSAVNEASQNGATEFSFVASGKKISNEKELNTLAQAIKYTKEKGEMEACTSLGLMSEEELRYLKGFGMDHFHHNLETARSHFPNIVTSHSYDEEIQTVKNAKNVGLHTCCGGIFGMGESWEQRLELAFELRDLDVDSVPMNYLNPIPGTPLASQVLLDPFEALKIVSIYRLIMPEKNIMVMGGREKVLRDLQSWIFFAGANGMLIGNYLITSGRSVEDDLKMIDDLGLTRKAHCVSHVA